MRVSRRAFVKAAAVASAAGATPVLAAATVALVIYDSRLPQSRLWAARIGGPVVDVAEQHATRWQTLRAPLPEGRIIGLTRWSDFILARGFAAEQRRPLRGTRRAGDLNLWDIG